MLKLIESPYVVDSFVSEAIVAIFLGLSALDSKKPTTNYLKKPAWIKKEKKKLHLAPHLSDVGATSAKTKSKLAQRAKTVKDPIHRGLFCILIS